MHGLGTLKKINAIADAKAKHQLAKEQRDSAAKPGETELEQRNREDADNEQTSRARHCSPAQAR
jgi:hypothetical protein